MTLYARLTPDAEAALRPDGLWAAILGRTADQGLGFNALFHALRRPGEGRRVQKLRLIRVLRQMVAHDLVTATGPIEPTDKGRQELALLQEGHRQGGACVTVRWYPSKSPDTIWNRLAARLGRQPTEEEAANEVRRILRDEPIGGEGNERG